MPSADLALQTLGAHAESPDGCRSARRTRRRERNRESTIVAVASRTIRVMHERDAAVTARQRGAAAPAYDHRRRTTAVEEENHLATGRVRLEDRLVEGRRQRTAVAGAQLLA